MITPGNLTPTETRIWRLLADGRPHPTGEMVGLLDDPLSGEKSLGVIIVYMRKKIGVNGFDVVCRKGSYRLLRTIGGDND